MDFADRLKDLRQRRGLTQSELGRRFNLSKQTISCYENRVSNPDPDTLKSMADFFDVSVDYLLGRTDDPTPLRPKNITTMAAHRTDDPMSDLPEEARRSVEEFLAYIRQKYGKKEDGKKEG